jgi:hypothetical protein
VKQSVTKPSGVKWIEATFRVPERRFLFCGMLDVYVDYYRTSFGTNLYQNNYWASAGIVLRLFGGSE